MNDTSNLVRSQRDETAQSQNHRIIEAAERKSLKANSKIKHIKQRQKNKRNKWQERRDSLLDEIMQSLEEQGAALVGQALLPRPLLPLCKKKKN